MRMCHWLVPACLLLAGVVQAATCPGESYAIRNARVLPVSGPALPRATVVLCQGIITAVSPDGPVPDGAEVIDGAGLTVFPGFLDAYSQYGLPPAQAGPPPARGVSGPPLRPLDAVAPNDPALYLTPHPVGNTPQRRAVDLLNPQSDLENVRAKGITSALVAPVGGVLQGEAALVNLRGPYPSSMVIQPDVALVAELRPQRGFGRYPSSVMGAVAVFRQDFLDAQQYEQAESIYQQASERGLPRPAYRSSVVSLLPALDGKQPVIFLAGDDNAILRSLRLAAEFKLRPIIAGGTQAWKVTPALHAAGAPVLVSLQFDPANKDELGTEELKKEQDENAANAARLAQAGIPFAFTSEGLKPKDHFLSRVRIAIAHGLSAEDALKALTLWPAQILAVDHQLGSIEPGKIGDLVLATGDPLAEGTQVRMLFIDGQPLPVHPESPKKDMKNKQKKTDEAGPPAGVNAVTLGATQ